MNKIQALLKLARKHGACKYAQHDINQCTTMAELRGHTEANCWARWACYNGVIPQRFVDDHEAELRISLDKKRAAIDAIHDPYRAKRKAMFAARSAASQVINQTWEDEYVASREKFLDAVQKWIEDDYIPEA